MALQDKTEPATQRKREDARKEGKVAKSNDINSALVLLASMIIFKVAGPYIIGSFMAMTRETFAGLHTHAVGMDGLDSLLMPYAGRAALICLPLMIGLAVVSLTSNVLQVGLTVSAKSVAMDLNRIDPIKGIARLFSIRSAVEALKSIAKIAMVGIVVYSFLKRECPALIGLSDMPPSTAGGVIAGMCWRLLVKACAAMLVIAMVDYLYQRYAFEESIKMTKQEVKEEFKRSEGDPQIKARLRQRQREIARGRMVQAVPKADVIVTNPTHIAVALKYDPDEMNAPTVVAKGQRLLAEKIKAIAEAHGIPIVENKPIARLLYKTVEVGRQIPEDLYQAVAEILAYVYRLSKKIGQR
ncbi:MAG TPA: flagellar biosynthesis protein FlhB [Armatimonadota bacterium]|nr:flagellar biosynthesis protein FlhB [Armatimonadota bacterium]